MNTKKAISILAALIVVGFIGYSIFGTSAKEEAISVRTGKTANETIVETLSTTGTLEAEQTQEIFGQGLVTEVDVAVGDQVEENDRLVLYQDGTAQTANFDGTVTNVNVVSDEADLSAQTGEAAITLADLSDLKVTVQLTKSDAPLVKKDQAVTLSNGSETYSGKVTHIDPVATTIMSQTGNTTALAATIGFDTPPKDVFAGFDIDSEITTNTAENAIALPIEALLYNDKNKPFVYVIEKGTARAQLIDIGIQSDTKVEVKDGLTADQTVILSPDEKIKDGVSVSAK
ncbi:MAG: HlyD family efflux transporter periplasmic adaptor subunit [Carnobacterium sp.]|uniref:efflux RND transporter periplasmic adaptor subunit n=1 Tax=Carnobacterium sp. TaxID=48221 RepID=UPI002FC618E1